MRALCVTLIMLAGGGAFAKPKLAALILKTGSVDGELADNLSEVLIARLARRGDYAIAGKEELRTKLGVDDRAAAECMQNMACLGRVGTELGVTRMVVGTLGARGRDYLYNLNLIDIATGRVDNRVFELVAYSKVDPFDPLIRAVQSTADKLFQPKIEPGAVRVTSETKGAMVYLDEVFIGGAPVRRDGIDPGQHQLRVEKEGHAGWAKDIEIVPGATMEVKVPLAAMPERRKWPGPLAASCFVVAGLALVTGIVMEPLAHGANASDNRVNAMNDARAHYYESIAGIAAFSLAGALTVTAVGLTIGYRHDIFGTSKKEQR